MKAPQNALKSKLKPLNRSQEQKYADLVLRAYDDQEHDSKREMLDRKAEIQMKARERL